MNIHDDVDERIRAALTAAAQEINGANLRAEHAPVGAGAPGAEHRARWLAPLLAAAAVVAVAVGTAAIVSTHNAAKVQPGHTVTPAPSTSIAATSATATPPPSRAGSTSPPATGTSSPVPQQSSTGTPVNCYFLDFGCAGPRHFFYQPLWPFANYAAEQAWQAASQSGAQPWHLDARQTALLFTQNYLGFTDITTVTSSTTDADGGVHIGVGYPLPNRKLHTAAVLHLVRYSSTVGDTTAGWEIVGSDDTDFSLEQPAYGSAVTSPMTVGGHITGVDENIVLDVKDLSGSVVTGTPPAVPAGGENSPWRSTVPFRATGVLTVVAFTGGHLTHHERFAIQGVHT